MARGSGPSDELGLERAIHHIRDPGIRAQVLDLERDAGVMRHADRRRVHDAVDVRCRGLEVVARDREHRLLGVERAHAFAERLGALLVDVGQVQLRDPAVEQGIGRGRAGTAAAELRAARETSAPGSPVSSASR